MAISKWQRAAWAGALALALAGCASGARAEAPRAVALPPHDVPGIAAEHLDPEHWVARLPQPDAPRLDADQLAAQNARMRTDPAIHDIEALPATLPAARVRAWIERLSSPPQAPLFDDAGNVVGRQVIAGLAADLALDAIPATQPARYAMVVRRADLRAFPTRLRVFSRQGDTDIDRFQESALFPGTPVAIVHASRDGDWYFVVSQTYAAWIEARHVAHGDKAAIFAHGRRTPYLVVTGATARTVFTPELPAVSDVQLEMGVRVPLASHPGDRPVNGQHPFASHVVELPVRGADGALAFAPALVPRSADVSTGYLPLTDANIIRQAFKFLGERYGWGHSYNARDCSGFVSEIYRSMGVLMPRNTRDQSVSAALERIAFDDGMDHARRLALLRATRVGDLIYIPGHVMLVVGHVDGMPYVIHDTSGMSYRRDDGSLRRLALNGVVVTPVLPMLAGEVTPTVDRITSIQRMRP